MLTPFRIHEPDTVDEALELLATLGEDAAVYAGGTEVILALKEGFLTFDHLIDIKRIPELRSVELHGDRVSLGSAVPYRSLEGNDVLLHSLPELTGLLRQIANVRVRTAGTLGGNLAFAEPHSDVAALLMMLDGRVHCRGGDGVRVVELSSFFVGPYESVLGPSELITAVEVTVPCEAAVRKFKRVCFHERPTANAGVCMRMDDGRIVGAALVTGASGPVPVRHTDLETALDGKTLEEVADASEDIVEQLRAGIDVMEDAYGSADYKKHLTGELIRRALVEAAADLQRANA